MSSGSQGLPSPRRMGLVTRALHWLSAALLAATFCLAWSFSTLGSGRTAGRLVDAHRSVGLLILALTTMRLAWRASHPLPSRPDGAAWETWLARGVQTSLYAALVAQPILGWASSSAQGDTVTFLGMVTLPDLIAADQDRADMIFGLHKLVGFAILALIATHVAGALRHGLIKRDGILQRMVTGEAAE